MKRKSEQQTEDIQATKNIKNEQGTKCIMMVFNAIHSVTSNTCIDIAEEELKKLTFRPVQDLPVEYMIAIYKCFDAGFFKPYIAKRILVKKFDMNIDQLYDIINFTNETIWSYGIERNSYKLFTESQVSKMSMEMAKQKAIYILDILRRRLNLVVSRNICNDMLESLNAQK